MSLPAAPTRPAPPAAAARSGALAAASCYFAWGLVPLYWKQLAGIAPLELIAHRHVWSLALVLLLVLAQGTFGPVRAALGTPRSLGLNFLSASLLTGNWLIYVWGVNTGHVIECSLGYFLVPLVNVALGRWVLHEACRQAARWQASGLPRLFVAVNLSAMQFRQGIVEADVRDALAATGLDPALLELELTESILLQSDDMVMSLLRRWKQLGIRLTIDDFGTGYSSLAYLKRLAVDKLKIDQSFVKAMVQGPQQRAIVSAIIQMAQSLNLVAHAEGIENADARLALQELGCPLGQGYFLARPQPAAEFEKLLSLA